MYWTWGWSVSFCTGTGNNIFVNHQYYITGNVLQFVCVCIEVYFQNIAVIWTFMFSKQHKGNVFHFIFINLNSWYTYICIGNNFVIRTKYSETVYYHETHTHSVLISSSRISHAKPISIESVYVILQWDISCLRLWFHLIQKNKSLYWTENEKCWKWYWI